MSGRSPATQTVPSRTAAPSAPVTTEASAAVPVTDPVRKGGAGRTRTLQRAGVGAVVALVAVAFVAAYRGVQARSARSTTGAVSRLADLPPSFTAVPEAESSYRRGMQLLARGESSAAKKAFDAAVAADPGFASPHLQRLIGETYFCPTDLPAARPHFQAASRARSTLAPRDQEVLDALEPAVLDPPDLREVAIRLRALAAKRPRDVQILEMVSIAENKLFHFAASAEAARREIALDPDEAIAGPMILAQDVGEAEARRALEDCLRRNKAAEWCRVEETVRFGSSGSCAEMEADARTMMVYNPESIYGPRTLVAALAGQGASVDALAVASADVRSRLDPAAVARAKAGDDVSLSLWSGDFAAAIAGIESSGAAGSPGFATMKVEALWESGDRRAAGEAALAYVKQAVALPRFERPETDPLPRMLARAHGGGALSDADYATQRDAWIDSWRRRLDGEAWTGAAPVVWAQAFAYPSSESEARAAVQRLPAFGPVPKVADRQFWTDDGPIGDLLLLSGRLEDALPRLRSGAGRCAVAMSVVRARLGLGQALESTGDTKGACASYAAVLRQWGAAKPRSVTAEAAGRRSAALGCAGADGR